MKTKSPRRPSASTLILRTKLTPPRVGSGWVARPRLVELLKGANDRLLLLLDAPVGYGKSALLAEWRSTEDRPFAWLSLEEADTDPTRLFVHIVASIRHHIPGSKDVLEPLLPVFGTGMTEADIQRTLDAISSIPGSFVIVLDDYHSLRGGQVQRLIEMFLDGLPPSIQLAIATRSDPPLSLGRLRAAGSMVELRAADLRFNVGEASALLAASGIDIHPDDVMSLVERTEGWPAGIYLATLSLRNEGDPSAFVRRFTGTHRHVADYLSEEVLARLPEHARTFLVWTSALDRMCAQLCDTALETSGSQAMLEELELSNLLVVPMDDDRTWFRYHHMFGEMLRADLARTDPELASSIRRRASGWFEAKGLHEEAVGHALAAHDQALAGGLIAQHWFAFFGAGRVETVRRWLVDLGDDAIERLPDVALVAGWVAALFGEPERMERWLAVADRELEHVAQSDGSTSLRFGVAEVRALFAFSGLDARRRNLGLARAADADGSRWTSLLSWAEADAALLEGDAEAAVPMAKEAVRLASDAEPVPQVLALSILSIAETELGKASDALAHARRAEEIVQKWSFDGDSRTSIVHLAIGRALIVSGRIREGHRALERALELRRSRKGLSPFPTLEVLAALAPVRLLHGDRDGALELLAEARGRLAELEGVGDLPARFAETERLLARSTREVGLGEALTEREMTILRLFPTRLSQRQIGSELFLSLNTVKSHSRAIYRKLGVSSRGEAVERARALELI